MYQKSSQIRLPRTTTTTQQSTNTRYQQQQTTTKTTNSGTTTVKTSVTSSSTPLKSGEVISYTKKTITTTTTSQKPVTQSVLSSSSSSTKPVQKISITQQKNYQQKNLPTKNVPTKNIQVKNLQTKNPNYRSQTYQKIADEYKSEKTTNKNVISLPKEKLKPRPKSPDPSEKIKTINRGDPFDNIQITHIISTKRPAEFHIFDNLSNEELSKPPLNLEENRKKLQKSKMNNATISITSSIDNLDIKPIEKNLQGKITIFQHCGGVGMTDLEKELITSNFYTSGIKEIPIRHRKKNQPKIEYVESWRTHDENTSPDKRFNFILRTQPKTEKKPPKPDELYNINVKITKRSNNFQRSPVTEKKVITARGSGKVFIPINIRRALQSYEEPDVKRKLRHYFMKYRNKTKLIQETDPITNISYVSWFNRNNNVNPETLNKKPDKLTEIIEPDETTNMINLITKQRDTVEPMPYEEWFYRHCTKRFDENEKLKTKKEPPIPENVTKMVNTLQKTLPKKSKNPYTEMEFKKIKDAVNKLPINEQKMAINILKKNANNEQSEQLDKLCEEIILFRKRNHIYKIINLSTNKTKKDKLNNIVTLWDEKPVTKTEETIKNEDYKNLDEKDKEVQLKKFNDLFNDKDYKTKEKSKTILIKNLSNLDPKNKEEVIVYLKTKNPGKNKENELKKVNTEITKNQQKVYLSKLMGAKTPEKTNPEDEKIKKILTLFDDIDPNSKENLLKYMKDTAGNDENKLKEFDSIIITLKTTKKNNQNDFNTPNDNNQKPDYNIENLKFELVPEKNLDENFTVDENEIPVSDANFLTSDELCDLVAEIDGENDKKKLADDEFDDLVYDLSEDLFTEPDTKDTKKKNEIEEEKLNNAENKLRALNQNDQLKTVELLKQNCDNKKKKDVVDKLQRRIKKIQGLKNMVKSFMDLTKKNENNNKNIPNVSKSELNQVADEVSMQLFPSNTPFDNKIVEQNKIEKVADDLQKLNKTDQVKALNLIRKSAKNPEHRNILKKLNTVIDNNNKINYLTNKLKPKNTNINKNKLQHANTVTENDNIKRLNENELKLLSNAFMDDLFQENYEPKTRSEKRDNDFENDKKLINVVKTINNLNPKDQEIILDNLNQNADDTNKQNQVNKVNNLLNNINNLKTYLNKLIEEKIKEEENKDNKNIKDKKSTTPALSENDFNELNQKVIDEIFPKYDVEDVEKEKAKVEDSLIKQIENDKLNKTADILNNLNDDQKKTILNNIKTEANKEKDPSKYNDLVKKLEKYNKLKEIINKLTKEKKDQLKKSKTFKPTISKKPTQKKFDKSKTLKEEEIKALTSGIINDIFTEENYVPLSATDEYLNTKEKKEKLNNVIEVVNGLNPQDQENVFIILNHNADNDNKKEVLRKLSTIIKYQNDTPVKIIKEEYIINEPNNYENKKTKLNDEQLGLVAEKCISELFSGKNNENENIRNLNRVANVLENLSKNDQEKVLNILKLGAHDKNEKDQCEKLERLVNNMNNMKLYLRTLIKNRNIDEEKKELPKSEISKISNEMVKNLYESNKIYTNDETPTPTDEKVNDNANIILKLNKKDQKKVLDNLKRKAKDDNSKNTYKILTTTVNFKNRMETINEKSKPLVEEKTITIKYTPEELNTVAEDISRELFSEDPTPTNSTEELLINENKDNKMNEIIEQLNKIPQNEHQKIFNIIYSKAENNSQKDQLSKLKNLVKNKNNDQKIIESEEIKNKPLEGDLTNEEIETLAKKFGDDIYNNSNTTTINNIANLICELDLKDQEKIMDILQKRAEKENELKRYNYLTQFLKNLNILKNPNKSEIVYLTDIPEVNPYSPILLKQILENNPEKIKEGDQEILVNELPPETLKELTDSLTDELFEFYGDTDEKVKNNIAYTIMKLNLNDQQKILDSMKEKAKGDKKKEPLVENLINKINNDKKMEDLAKEIKNEQIQKNNDLEEKTKELSEIYNNNENMDEKQLKKYTTEFANELFVPSEKSSSNKKLMSVNKTQNYLNKQKEQETINNIACIVNNFSENDKVKTFEILNKLANNDEKIQKLQKLAKVVNNLNKMSAFSQRIKSKAIENIQENPNVQDKNELRNLSSKYSKELTNDNVNDIAIEISHFELDQQKVILDSLRNKDKNLVDKVKKLVNNLNKMKGLALKIKEKQAQKKIEEQIKNEENYGVYIISQKVPENNEEAEYEVIIQEKPEMDEDDFNELTDTFTKDLYSNSDNKSDLTGVEKYKKEKEIELNINNIAKAMDNLNENDKEKALKALNDKADNKYKRASYENLVKQLKKAVQQRQKEKLLAQREAAREVEETNAGNKGYYNSFVKMIKTGLRQKNKK